MKKRVIVTFILMFLAILVTLPLATAQFFQQAPQLPSGSFIAEILSSDYFVFLALFTIFFGLTSALLRKFFQRGSSIAISFPLALLVAAGGMFSGFFDLTKLGIFAIVLFFLLFAEIFLGVFGKKQGFAKSVLWLNLAVLGGVILVASLFGDYLSEYLALILWLGTVVGLLSLLFYFLSGTTSRERAVREQQVAQREPWLRSRWLPWNWFRGRQPRTPTSSTLPTGLSVTITNPVADGQQFAENQNISFQARIFGGDEPFDFNILVDGGVVQRGNTAWATIGTRNISLNLGRLSQGNHGIQVVVTDRNRQRATETRSIIVTSTSTAAFRIDSVTPASGDQGQRVNVTVVGAGFASGIRFNFGRSINASINSIDPSGNSAILTLDIAATAGPGPRNVSASIRRGLRTQRANLPNGFTVNSPGALRIDSVDPAQGEQGQNLRVEIRGAGFVTGSTTFDFGRGIAVTLVSVNPTGNRAIADLGIDSRARIGMRNVSVTVRAGRFRGTRATARDAFEIIAPGGARGDLWGNVTDARTGNRLDGVAIELTGPTTITIPSATGGRYFRGRYLQRDIPAGTYNLTATLTGYIPFRAKVTINAGRTTKQDIAMQPQIPGQFTLTINATANGSQVNIPLTWKINGYGLTTNMPYTARGMGGKNYTIDMPSTINVGGVDYNFDKWNDGDINSRKTVLLNNDITLTAEYVATAPPQFELKVYATGNGAPAGVNFTVNGNFATTQSMQRLSLANYVVEMPDIASFGRNDYRFVKWDDGNTNRIRNVNLDRDVSLVAEYTKVVNQFELKVYATANGSGQAVDFIINGRNGITPLQQTLTQQDYAIEMPVTITISGKQYRFDKWAADVTGINPKITVTLNRNLTLVAQYVEEKVPQKIQLQVINPQERSFILGGIIPIRLRVVGGKPNYTYDIEIDGRRSKYQPSSSSEYAISINSERLGLGIHKFRFSVEDSTGANDSKEIEIKITLPPMRIKVKVPANKTTLDLTKGGDIPLQIHVDNGAKPFLIRVFDENGDIIYSKIRRDPPISGFIKDVRNRLSPGQHTLRFIVTDENDSIASQDVIINLIYSNRRK